MHRRISVSAMCTATWTLEEDVVFWGTAGITNVGVSLRKLEQAGVDAGAGRIAGAGLRVTNLLGLGFDLVDRGRWPAHQARLISAIDAGRVMGAECLVLTTGAAHSMTWEEGADALTEAVAPVSAAADAAGVPFAIEHTNSLRVDVGFVHTLRDVVELARRLNVGVVMECNACWAERDLSTTIREGVSAGIIRLVQVSDFVIGTLRTPDRAVPGDGDVPLQRLLGQLLDAGYGGVFDLEVIGPRIESEGYRSAVPRSIEALAAILERLGL